MMINVSLPEDDLGGQGEAEARGGGWGGLHFQIPSCFYLHAGLSAQEPGM